MADAELVSYIKNNLRNYGAETLRGQLIKDGVAPEEIDAALVEATAAVGRPGGLARYAVLGGAVLLVLAILLSVRKPGDAPAPAKDPRAGETEDAHASQVFRGHYGYIMKLPPGYEAFGAFRDPNKTEEVVYVFPKGTDPIHFIHEGLYGSLGILRLEVTRRRVPQGQVAIDQLKLWITGKLDQEKSTYSVRDLQVNGMEGFLVNAEKPFKYAKAYMVGEKVRYTLTGGEETGFFSDILSSLIEADPHDRPGT